MSKLMMKLIEENRRYKKFFSDDFKDVNGYQELLRDLVAGVKIRPENYTSEMQKWLAENMENNE